MYNIMSKLLVIACLLSATLFGYAANNTLLEQANVKVFINEMVKQHHFNEKALKTLFSNTKILPEVISKIKAPYEEKPWNVYRKHFLTDKRIEQGKQYWKKYQNTFTHVESTYGIPTSVIVSIIGVESHYGLHRGKFRVMDSLATLAFDYPPRAKFFRQELVNFLLLTRDQKLDPLSLYGSYAGAIGQPQFMPSSYRHYAVDYDKNGHVDLGTDTNDVIASVANYLKKNGWHNNEPIAVQAQIAGQIPAGFVSKKIHKPNRRLSQYKLQGITPMGKIQGDPEAMLVALDIDNGKKEYWLVFHNFYVITRYNPSIQYAMAVFSLSKSVES